MRARGEIYKEEVQLVLLYGSERLMVNGEMLKILTTFHHWEA